MIKGILVLSTQSSTSTARGSFMWRMRCVLSPSSLSLLSSHILWAWLHSNIMKCHIFWENQMFFTGDDSLWAMFRRALRLKSVTSPTWFKRCEHTYKAFHPFFPQIRSGLLGNWWNLHWVLLCVSFVKTCRNFINKKFPPTIKQQTNHARQEFFAKVFYYIEYIYIFNFKHSGTYI